MNFWSEIFHPELSNNLEQKLSVDFDTHLMKMILL